MLQHYSILNNDEFKNFHVLQYAVCETLLYFAHFRY